MTQAKDQYKLEKLDMRRLPAKYNLTAMSQSAGETNDPLIASEETPSASLFIPKPYSAQKMIDAVRHFQH
jgi:hypothetical protein